ncbi:hypothetical protein [Micromonospora sp. CB01531]|uniref:hypothetical protein n=1 Tax=Micromonospora sp. CB01531 TaxID=1718947 RepID=UPI001F528067|nr:hypothetical protein [Micromonospora sp. CB01531]
MFGSAVPASAASRPLSHARIVAHFDVAAGQQPENILVEPGGVDLVFAGSFQVVRIGNDGRRRVLATLPAPDDGGVNTPGIGVAIATGIARGTDGSLYVGYAAGGDDLTGVWRIRPGEKPERVIPLTAASFPNGIDVDQRTGDIYVADSSRGILWRAPSGGGIPVVWSAAPELAPTTLFGANGLKVHDGAVWTSNRDRGTLLRIPLGRHAGRVETRFTGAPGIDDFAFAGDSVLAANVGANEVVLITPDGTSSTVLTGADGLQQPTAVAIDGHTVYVTSAAYFSRQDPNLLVAHLNGR